MCVGMVCVCVWGWCVCVCVCGGGGGGGGGGYKRKGRVTVRRGHVQCMLHNFTAGTLGFCPACPFVRSVLIQSLYS